MEEQQHPDSWNDLDNKHPSPRHLSCLLFWWTVLRLPAIKAIPLFASPGHQLSIKRTIKRVAWSQSPLFENIYSFSLRRPPKSTLTRMSGPKGATKNWRLRLSSSWLVSGLMELQCLFSEKQSVSKSREGKTLRLFPELASCKGRVPTVWANWKQWSARAQKHCQIHFKLNLVLCLAKLLITKECLSADEKLHWGFFESPSTHSSSQSQDVFQFH